MSRGRKPGQGQFTGGRSKTSPNKKGHFETSLPPVRCSGELKAWYVQKAQAAGQELSTYLRQVISLLKENEEAATDNKSLHGTTNRRDTFEAAKMPDVYQNDSYVMSDVG